MKVVTIEKPVEKIVVREKMGEAKSQISEKPDIEIAAEPDPTDKWNQLADVRSNIYQVQTISINRQIRKGEPIDWGSMGLMDHAYLLIKQKETNLFNIQFIFEGEKTYEPFYKYTGAADDNNTLYTRVDGNWDEQLVTNKPLEFVMERLQTEGRTFVVMVNYTRGVGAKVLFWSILAEYISKHIQFIEKRNCNVGAWVYN